MQCWSHFHTLYNLHFKLCPFTTRINELFSSTSKTWFPTWAKSQMLLASHFNKFSFTQLVWSKSKCGKYFYNFFPVFKVSFTIFLELFLSIFYKTVSFFCTKKVVCVQMFCSFLSVHVVFNDFSIFLTQFHK